jgi:hypothetical protein
MEEPATKLLPRAGCRSTSGDPWPPVVVQPLAQAHRDSLIATKTRRLHLLEQQQARQGPSTPVDVQLEIEDLRAELDRLGARRECDG